jgi:hypothetical protein
LAFFVTKSEQRKIAFEAIRVSIDSKMEISLDYKQFSN